MNVFLLKVQSCKLYNNKYMITSTQISNSENFAFIAALIFTLLSRKVVFINRKDNRNWWKVGYFLRKQHISRVNYCKIIDSWNVKFSGYIWNTQAIIYQCFFNWHDCSFNLSAQNSLDLVFTKNRIIISQLGSYFYTRCFLVYLLHESIS